jgi:hypothetical protein
MCKKRQEQLSLFHAFALQDNIIKLSSTTWQEINKILILATADAEIENGRKIRTDATSVLCAILEPSDSSLLRDGVRIITHWLQFQSPCKIYICRSPPRHEKTLRRDPQQQEGRRQGYYAKAALDGVASIALASTLASVYSSLRSLSQFTREALPLWRSLPNHCRQKQNSGQYILLAGLEDQFKEMPTHWDG